MDEGIKIGMVLLVVAIVLTIGGVWIVQKKFGDGK